MMHSRLAAAAALTLLLAACATPGERSAPLATLAPAAAGLAADAATAAVDEQWWRSLGDPALDALVARALADQPSLQQAAARLARASAAAATTEAAHGPQVGLGVDATRQRYTEHGLYPSPIAGNYYNSGTLQASAGWELDFFGRNRAALQAALGQQQAARAELAAARVLLASNVARGYVALARLLDQRAVTQRTLAQREEMLGLTRQRVQAGVDTELELRQAEGAVPEARQQLEAVDEQVQLARHQLALLSAQPPSALDGLKPSLQPLAVPALPERLGADLLGRRADVVAARWRIEAAGQEVKAAEAQFYPDVNLTAFFGYNALGLDNVLQAGSRNFGVGPALRLPLFDGGRLRAQLGGRAAEFDAAVAAYNGAVFDAVREAADAVASLRSVARQQAEQAAAQAAADAAYALALQRQRSGLGSYLNVLATETAVLAQRRSGVELRARALDGRVALMRALGGGWRDEQAAATAPAPIATITTITTTAAATPVAAR